MEECEICGKQSRDIYIVNLEGAELRVCTKCAKGKKIVSRVVERVKMTAQAARAKKEVQIIDNYGIIIHNARESMRLPIKVLAEMLNEKETLLLRIEQQKTMPSEELAKKLEKALKVRLAESDQPEASGLGGIGKVDKATLGDFIKK